MQKTTAMEPLPVSTRNGTLGGTLLVVLIQVNAGELVKSAVLAATGAAVSFFVTLLLRRVTTRRKLSSKP